MELVRRQRQWSVLDNESALQSHTRLSLEKAMVGAGSGKEMPPVLQHRRVLGVWPAPFTRAASAHALARRKHWTRSVVQAPTQRCRSSPASPRCWSWCNTTAIADVWRLGSLPPDDDNNNDGNEAWKILFFPWRFQSLPVIAIMLRNFF